MAKQGSNSEDVPGTGDPNRPVADVAVLDQGSTPTPSGDGTFDADAVARQPGIQEAFQRVFGAGESGEEGPKGPTPAQRRQREEEAAEELQGLDGATPEDDGVEPQPEGEPQPTPKADETPGEPGAGTDAGEEGADAPTLSPLLIHAARRAGMTDEDISGLIEKDEALAERTFQRLLDSFNSLSAEYGRMGIDGQPTQTPSPQPTPQQPPTPAQEQANLLAQIYGDGDAMGKLKEKYGADYFDDIVVPLLAPVQEAYAMVQRQQLEGVARQIGDFFRALPEEFAELYGEGDQATEEQLENRTKLAGVADTIRGGAGRRGIELSVGESLERANFQFAAEHMETLARKRITQQVQKRASQLTQRPSQRRAKPAGEPAAEGAGSIESATAAYVQRAAELGIEV